MRNSILTGLLAVGGVVGFAACDSFVEDIDGPIDRVVSDSLNTPEQVSFLITGVEEGFNDSYDALAVISDLLSDAALFDQDVQNATFPTFDFIDDGEIEPDNNTVDGAYGAINEYRFLADELLRRVEQDIEFGEDDAAVRDEATYAANFHGGIARYMLGTFFGPDTNTLGAPISDDPDAPGPPLPQTELYSQADAKLAAAAAAAPSDYDQRVVNTIRARIALFGGDRAAAAGFAANGLQEGDDPFTGDYASTSQNNWWTQGGRGRTQVASDFRFADFDTDDDRTLVEEAPTVAGVTQTYFRQSLYLNNSDPIPFVTWQENSLILAEADVFDGGDSGTADDLIDAVLASFGVDDDGDEDADQDELLRARDQALFTQGLRLVDQRRFNLPFTNNDGPITGPWRWFPLTQTERNANPNL